MVASDVAGKLNKPSYPGVLKGSLEPLIAKAHHESLREGVYSIF